MLQDFTTPGNSFKILQDSIQSGQALARINGCIDHMTKLAMQEWPGDAEKLHLEPFGLSHAQAREIADASAECRVLSVSISDKRVTCLAENKQATKDASSADGFVTDHLVRFDKCIAKATELLAINA